MRKTFQQFISFFFILVFATPTYAASGNYGTSGELSALFESLSSEIQQTLKRQNRKPKKIAKKMKKQRVQKKEEEEAYSEPPSEFPSEGLLPIIEKAPELNELSKFITDADEMISSVKYSIEATLVSEHPAPSQEKTPTRKIASEAVSLHRSPTIDRPEEKTVLIKDPYVRTSYLDNDKLDLADYGRLKPGEILGGDSFSSPSHDKPQTLTEAKADTRKPTFFMTEGPSDSPKKMSYPDSPVVSELEKELKQREAFLIKAAEDQQLSDEKSKAENEHLKDLLKNYKDILQTEAPSPDQLQSPRTRTPEIQDVTLNSMKRLMENENFRNKHEDIVYQQMIGNIVDTKLKDSITSYNDSLYNKLLNTIVSLPNQSRYGPEKIQDTKPIAIEAIIEKHGRGIEKSLIEEVVALTDHVNDINKLFSEEDSALKIHNALDKIEDSVVKKITALDNMKILNKDALVARLSNINLPQEDRALSLLVLLDQFNNGNIIFKREEIETIITQIDTLLPTDSDQPETEGLCFTKQQLEKERGLLQGLMNNSEDVFYVSQQIENKPKEGFISKYTQNLKKAKTQLDQTAKRLKEKLEALKEKNTSIDYLECNEEQCKRVSIQIQALIDRWKPSPKK